MNDMLLLEIAGGMLICSATLSILSILVFRRVSSKAMGRCISQASLQAQQTSEHLEQISQKLSTQLELGLSQLDEKLTEARQLATQLEQLCERVAPASSPTPNALQKQAHQLFRSGMKPLEIARQMQIDVGEVELMLNLVRLIPRRRTNQPTQG